MVRPHDRSDLCTGFPQTDDLRLETEQLGYEGAVPTVHREAGWTFRIYPRDHDPPHVHAVGGDGFVKIRIGDESRPPRIIDVGRKTKAHEIGRVVRIVEREWRVFLDAWRRVHGQESVER